MRTNLQASARALALSSVLALTLTGCGNALIYGEGTNFSLTTLRLNDDPATPVRVVSGLDRTVGAVVPRRNHDGDAVNMAANFDLRHPKGEGLFSVFSDTLSISTEFAAGAAAVAGPNAKSVTKDVKPLGVTKEEDSKELRPSPLAQEIIGR